MMKRMGVQDVSILQILSYTILNITHLTAMTQYKWDHLLKIKHLHSFVGAFFVGEGACLSVLITASFIVRDLKTIFIV